MTARNEGSGFDHAWFLGAAFGGGNEDQSERFIREGIWEHNFQDRYIDEVKSIRSGDRIAIKATYTRKNDLPFDNRGRLVQVMAIKAVGIVTANPGDGRRILVEWTPVVPPREWYFYAHLPTVWKVVAGEWKSDSLLRFVFDDEPQDIDRFRNAPYWADRYGDQPKDADRFAWSTFYTEFADRLLAFRDDRQPLISAIHELSKLEVPLRVEDRFSDDSSGHLRDICPFTTFGLFNRGISDDNRRRIARLLGDAIGVTAPVPESFEGIPVLSNFRSWFFPFATTRSADHIDVLWRVLSDALDCADSGDSTSRQRFADSFDAAIALPEVGPMLTIGLYWVRPWHYPPLDGPSYSFITGEMKIEVDKPLLDGAAYLSLGKRLEAVLMDEDSRINSLPELSAAAFNSARMPAEEPVRSEHVDESEEAENEGETEADDGKPYSVEDIIGDGCFLGAARLETMLERLRDKKNLILQGPPGTGKTWLAKRLAYALIGRKSESRVRPFQFHPNLSYEDFVRGWRPKEGGGLRLVDGPFLEAVEAAAGNPDDKYVVVIEEINRGNPAQIFGEMLTLLEADKRKPAEAIALSYPRPSGERVHIPPNLYVIGTMNVADRSLALVDFALRRRFAFVDLEPTFGDTWRTWVSEQCGIEEEFLQDIETRLGALNNAIADDAVLGAHFRIGHSVVTPPPGVEIQDQQQWFRHVVETEIMPLLGEYWFDDPKKAESEGEKLFRGLTP